MSRWADLIDATAGLPSAQSEVLLPLLALALQGQAPPGAVTPPPVREMLEDFKARIAADTAEAVQANVSALLVDAGVSAETYRALALRMGVAEGDPQALALLAAPATHFAAREAPAPGQVRSGALARHALATTLKPK